MGIRCAFGHDSEDAVWNAGIFFGDCDRCGRALIRGVGGRWHAIPKGLAVRDEKNDRPIAPSKLLRMARRKAPLLHRLRRRQAYSGYFD